MNKQHSKIFIIFIFFYSFFLINNSIHADTLIVPIITSSDDVEEMEVNGNMLLNSNNLQLVDERHKNQTVGLRFSNITIPPRAVVLNAYIEFTSQRRSFFRAEFNFHGDASASAAPFLKERYNLTNRSQTSASVTWSNVPNWPGSGRVFQSPNLSQIIQEIIAQPGWTSGNSLAFVIDGYGQRSVVSFDGGAADAPRLIIEFTPVPDLVVLKSVQTLSDPINGSFNPKAIPGAEMLYTVNVTNFGTGSTDLNSVVTTDPIPLSSALFVGDFFGGMGPILFFNGAVSSGLNYTYGGLNDNSDDLEFSNNNGTTFDYIPNPDAYGYDDNVTHFRINPKGQFNAAINGVTPSYTIYFKIRVQ